VIIFFFVLKEQYIHGNFAFYGTYNFHLRFQPQSRHSSGENFSVTYSWITAVGPIEGNQVLMNIEMTSGGIFDSATDIIRTDPPGSDGTILLTFDSCNSGTVEYDIPSINKQGTVPIQRVAGDNIALCEAINAD
jgi:hypothetical protein